MFKNNRSLNCNQNNMNVCTNNQTQKIKAEARTNWVADVPLVYKRVGVNSTILKKQQTLQLY